MPEPARTPAERERRELWRHAFPLLFIAFAAFVAALVLGLQPPHVAGIRIPLWILPAAIAVVAGCGGAMLLAIGDFGFANAPSAASGTESDGYVRIRREDWERLQRLMTLRAARNRPPDWSEELEDPEATLGRPRPEVLRPRSAPSPRPVSASAVAARPAAPRSPPPPAAVEATPAREPTVDEMLSELEGISRAASRPASPAVAVSPLASSATATTPAAWSYAPRPRPAPRETRASRPPAGPWDRPAPTPPVSRPASPTQCADCGRTVREETGHVCARCTRPLCEACHANGAAFGHRGYCTGCAILEPMAGRGEAARSGAPTGDADDLPV